MYTILVMCIYIQPCSYRVDCYNYVFMHVQRISSVCAANEAKAVCCGVMMSFSIKSEIQVFLLAPVFIIDYT